MNNVPLCIVEGITLSLSATSGKQSRYVQKYYTAAEMFKYLKAIFGQVLLMKSKTKPLHTLILNISRHNRIQTKENERFYLF